VRGVLGPLLECRPASLHIVNRTADRARALADRFGEAGFARVSGGGLHTSEAPYDVVINGTAASLGGKIPELDRSCIDSDTFVYDMMYGAVPTPFMDWAVAAGAKRTADGLGMLVEQAAESFFVWHDQRPDTGPVIVAIRDTIRQSTT